MPLSKGAKKILTYLERHPEIPYSLEIRFPLCKDINTLPFDFLIVVNGITGIIEYDGEQHFKKEALKGILLKKGNTEISTLDLTLAFNKILKHDIIKNKYCRDNSLSLLRIPYSHKGSVDILIETFIARLRKEKLPVMEYTNKELYPNPYGEILNTRSSYCCVQ